MRNQITITLVAVTLGLLPTVKSLFPIGEQYFECNRYSQIEIAHGVSLWIHQKEQKNYP